MSYDFRPLSRLMDEQITKTVAMMYICGYIDMLGALKKMQITKDIDRAYASQTLKAYRAIYASYKSNIGNLVEECADTITVFRNHRGL